MIMQSNVIEIPREWLFEPHKVPDFDIDVIEVVNEDQSGLLDMGQVSPRASVGGSTLYQHTKHPRHDVKGISRVTLRLCNGATESYVRLRVHWETAAAWHGSYDSLYFFAPVQINMLSRSPPVVILNVHPVIFTIDGAPCDASRSILFMRHLLQDSRLRAWTDRIAERLPERPKASAIDLPKCCAETLIATHGEPVPGCEHEGCPVLHNDYALTYLEAGGSTPIKFPGRLIGCADTRERQPSTLRVYGLNRLYQTVLGNYVCEQVTKCLEKQAHPVRHVTVVPGTVPNLSHALEAFFGRGLLLTELLADAGLSEDCSKIAVNE